jgi:N-acetylmuramoyl-L-alanine amidase
MKTILGLGALAGLAIFVVQARGERAEAVQRQQARPAPERRLGWNEFERSFGPRVTRSPQISRAAAQAKPAAPAPNVDVVDAHWMALTMWGEARGDGEAGMRAVGHVIDNRRRARAPNPRFVTDTVSEAWQFGCWNRADPNYTAMLNIDMLPVNGHDYRMWRLARQLAEEVMSGRSEDPTDGSLFYHGIAVAPRWSDGIVPIRRIGAHVFFRTARRES